MIPEIKTMTNEESKELMDKFSSPEYWEKRNKSYEQVGEVFKEQDKIWAYCKENNCTVDDLINAHKREVLRDKELGKATII